MNPIGVHSHLFRGGPTLVAEAMARLRLSCVQLTPNFPGLRFFQPGDFSPDRCRQTVDPFLSQGLAICCLSGGRNLFDPDLAGRHRCILRWHALIRHCRHFATDKVMVETGTPSPLRRSDTNLDGFRPAFWTELIWILQEGLRLADDSGVAILVKPEVGHLVATWRDACRLKEELDHPNLGFVMDPATFLAADLLANLDDELEQMWTGLGPWCPVVHAKDLRLHGEGIARPGAGRGQLDYARFSHFLRRFQPTAPIILEHLRPHEIPEAKSYLERALLDSAAP
jgi:sugar phosphate isomerase/epimerase